MRKIIKRDGRRVNFHSGKIYDAIQNAFDAVGKETISKALEKHINASGKYNLYTNNCLDKSFSLVSAKGVHYPITIRAYSITPKYLFQYVFLFHILYFYQILI